MQKGTEQKISLAKMFKDYPDVLNVQQLCMVLDISDKTAYNLLKTGQVKSKKVGRAYKIAKVYVIAYLKSK